MTSKRHVCEAPSTDSFIHSFTHVVCPSILSACWGPGTGGTEVSWSPQSRGKIEIVKEPHK